MALCIEIQHLFLLKICQIQYRLSQPCDNIPDTILEDSLLYIHLVVVHNDDRMQIYGVDLMASCSLHKLLYLLASYQLLDIRLYSVQKFVVSIHERLNRQKDKDSMPICQRHTSWLVKMDVRTN